jgi:hypothetical protein
MASSHYPEVSRPMIRRCISDVTQASVLYVLSRLCRGAEPPRCAACGSASFGRPSHGSYSRPKDAGRFAPHSEGIHSLVRKADRLRDISCVILILTCLLHDATHALAAQQPSRPAGASVSERVYWIGSPAAASRAVTLYFRQTFTLRTLPEAMRLRVAARDGFRAYANGTPVLEGRAGQPEMQTAWVTREMRAGRNALAFECPVTKGENGLQFEAMIRYKDGRTVYVVSNGDERVSGEFARGWNEPDFNDRRWPTARVVSRESRVESGKSKVASLSTFDFPLSTLDYTRIIRVWDITAGGKPGADPYARPRAVGERMLLTTSVPSAADFPAVASAGFTLYQTDSDHLSTEETAPGVWDFRAPDAASRFVRQQGFDWCYFPHFAFPPKWYREQVPFTRIRCLEHNQTAEAFSPWEPKFGSVAARGYEKLTEHYGEGARGRGGDSRLTTHDSRLSGLYLGVHGDYGECGLLMGARVSVPGQREEWRARFGDLHDHLGWWCADPLARASFRDQMMRKYRDLDVLNAAWKTKFNTPEEIAYPNSPGSGSRRYWLDFVTWYMSSASSLTDTICRIARRAFPDTLLMLPVGFGDENPRGGNDNSLIPKIAARYGVDVRSTHGGFQPFAQNQATMLGRIASACRFYGAPFWTEPPSRITAEGQVARIFAAASLGSKGYFDWADNVRDTRDVYYRYGKYLKVEQPVVDVAMFYPTTSHLLQPDVGYPRTFMQGCAAIRDVLNYDTVDERMIRDGALERYRVLVMWEGTVVEKETLDRIRDWAQAGGVLAAYDFGKIETVEGDRAWFSDLFGYAGRLNPATVGLRFLPETGKGVADRYRISVGQPNASAFLSGGWYEAETLGGVARRWTGASAEVRVPVNPARAYSLLLRASFPPEAARKRREVLVNGVKVGALDAAEETTYRFEVPAAALAGRDTAVISIRSETWIPADVLRGSEDRRALGTWVTYVEMDSTGGAPLAADPGPPSGRFETVIDLKRLRSEWAKPYGRGWTVYFPATRRQLNGFYEVVRYLTYHLSDLDSTKRDAISVDDAWDGMYATLLSDKILYYNPGPNTISRTIVLNPSAFEGRRDVATPAVLTHNLTIEPNSIAAIYLGAQPQELLLQCEKFTELGGLRPSTGAEFSPGQGMTHVLIPAGRQIATRFECDAARRYLVFYRVVRRGALAQAEVTIDGKPLESRESRVVSRESAAAQTLLAGTVNLTRGVHSLVIRPRRGEDLRADFVILTTDPTIAGYGFAVKRISAGR